MLRGRSFLIFPFSGFAKGTLICRLYSIKKDETLILPSDPDGTDISSGKFQGLGSEDFSDNMTDNPNFDVVEASAQEMHDLCYGIISFLRRADPDANPALFQKRSQRRLREPVAEQYRRLLHGHYDRTLARTNNFRSKQDFDKAIQMYFEMGEKVLALLNKPLLDRLVFNAGKCCRERRSDGVHKYRNIIAKASWRTFPHRWYRHSPFEIQKLRADIKPGVVENARFYRDNSTIRYLFALMEPQHPYREPIERRIFQLTDEYNPNK